MPKFVFNFINNKSAEAYTACAVSFYLAHKYNPDLNEMCKNGSPKYKKIAIRSFL